MHTLPAAHAVLAAGYAAFRHGAPGRAVGLDSGGGHGLGRRPAHIQNLQHDLISRHLATVN